ncbi:MAG TPA: mechanosensitive ion channel family protein [Burkholderiales bacterium]|nr:mechanosensitive ion channel family protein [Burkholderiales bacterium]
MELLPAAWQPYLWSVLALLGVALLALLGHRVLFYAAGRIAARAPSAGKAALLRLCRRPSSFALPLLAVFVALPGLPWPQSLTDPIEHLVVLGLIGAVAWLCLRLIDVLVEVLGVAFRVDVKDNLRARKIETQVHLLRRIAAVVIAFVAGSLMLMTFPSIRHVGLTLFASAGLAGLVAGMAARSTLSNLLAGVQIALTEPIRIDDVVIVEGEWGWIEEIGTTYVVVRIWDLRRLVVPLSYFIEHPFQNWTRVTADLLGTVFVYADYTVPVEEVRAELLRILQASGMWDGKVWGLQVTDATEHTLQLRALMSAPDSNNAWDLRCHVREKLIAYLQQRHPESLPRLRGLGPGAGALTARAAHHAQAPRLQLGRQRRRARGQTLRRVRLAVVLQPQHRAGHIGAAEDIAGVGGERVVGCEVARDPGRVRVVREAPGLLVLQVVGAGSGLHRGVRSARVAPPGARDRTEQHCRQNQSFHVLPPSFERGAVAHRGRFSRATSYFQSGIVCLISDRRARIAPAQAGAAPLSRGNPQLCPQILWVRLAIIAPSNGIPPERPAGKRWPLRIAARAGPRRDGDRVSGTRSLRWA